MSALAIAATVEAGPDQILNVASRSIMEAAAREIFEVMLGLKLTRIAADPPVVADVTVLVGFSGQWRGVFGLHCQANTACRMATLAVGVETDEFDERVLDAVGEIANMVAGSFKSKIPALSETAFLSVPSIISGADYERHSSAGESKGGVSLDGAGGEHLEMSLSCEGSPLWLTLDLRK